MVRLLILIVIIIILFSVGFYVLNKDNLSEEIIQDENRILNSSQN